MKGTDCNRERVNICAFDEVDSVSRVGVDDVPCSNLAVGVSLADCTQFSLNGQSHAYEQLRPPLR